MESHRKESAESAANWLLSMSKGARADWVGYYKSVYGDEFVEQAREIAKQKVARIKAKKNHGV